MAVDILDFAREVELSRRELINNAIDKGYPIDAKASLQKAVLTNINLTSKYIPATLDSKYRIRFFDADGTILKTEYVEHGGTATPPENPNLDPERLTFKQWVSAKKDDFTNIEYPMDYGAEYIIQDNNSFIFFKLTEDTGLTVNMKFSNSTEVNWGDGSVNTEGTALTHSYSEYGNYCIELLHGSKLRTQRVITGPYILGSEELDNEITHVYQEYPYSDGSLVVLGSYAKNINYLICNKMDSPNYVWVHARFMIIPEITFAGYSRIDLIGYQRDYDPSYIITGGKYTGNCYLNLTYPPFYTQDILVTECPVNGTDQAYYRGINTIVSLGNYEEVSSTLSFPKAERIILKPLTGKVINLPKTSAAKEYIYPTESYSIQNIPPSVISESDIKTFIIPTGIVNVSTTAFSRAYKLENLVIPKDFDFSLDLHWCIRLSKDCLISIYNNLKDNSGSSARTLTFYSYYNIIENIYIKNQNGLWVLSNKNDLDSISYTEALANKNWTVGLTSSYS